MKLDKHLQTFKTSLTVIFLLSVVTACGSGSSSQTGFSLPASEANAAGESVPSGEIETPVTQPTANENPPAGTNTNAGVSEPYVVNPDVLAAASNVGCEASAEVFKQTMVELINAARVDTTMCGDMQLPAVDTLVWNNQLAAAAAAHATDMTTHNFFDHTGTDGLGVSERADTAGYNWSAVGENIAAGQISVDEVHTNWMESEGHCKNVMNTLFTEVGAACMDGPDTFFGTYWVVVFGDTRDQP